jgi:hypothetical protein
MNLFGKKKKEAPIPAPSITRSIGVLNDARVQLEKRQTHLTKQIGRENSIPTLRLLASLDEHS